MFGSKSHYANLPMWPQNRLPEVFYKDHPGCGFPALSSAQVRDLPVGHLESPADDNSAQIKETPKPGIARFKVPLQGQIQKRCRARKVTSLKSTSPILYPRARHQGDSGKITCSVQCTLCYKQHHIKTSRESSFVDILSIYCS